MRQLVDNAVDILARHAGLDGSILGLPLIEQAINTRFKQLGLNDPRKYAAMLEDDTELRHLLELTLIGETWFFRDCKPFIFLAEQAAQLRRPLHILCAPCSTGEEAYSIAIALLEKGLHDFHIDAMDISRQSLHFAIEATYGARSFREDMPQFDRFFTTENNNRKVIGAGRSHITFRPINLANNAALALLGNYDFIFCRNLLIYFLLPLREQLLMALRRCLRPDGLLFTGHSELVAASCNELEICREPGVFALRRICVQGTKGTHND